MGTCQKCLNSAVYEHGYVHFIFFCLKTYNLHRLVKFDKINVELNKPQHEKIGLPAKCDKHQPVQSQKKARNLNFWIVHEE